MSSIRENCVYIQDNVKHKVVYLARYTALHDMSRLKLTCYILLHTQAQVARVNA